MCLLDVPRLADDELAALEDYVRDGGGLALFVGPNTDRAFYNERLYRKGDGLFPVPLKLPTQLLDPTRRGNARPGSDRPSVVSTCWLAAATASCRW